MFRPYSHEKRARFNPNVRSNDAIVIRGNDEEQVRVTGPRKRNYANGKNYIGDCKRIWVKRVELNLAESLDDIDGVHGLKPAGHRIAKDVVNNTEANVVVRDSLVQRHDASSGGKASLHTESIDQEMNGNSIQPREPQLDRNNIGTELGLQKGKDRTTIVSTSTNWSAYSVSTRTNAVMENSSSGISRSRFMQCANSGSSVQQRQRSDRPLVVSSRTCQEFKSASLHADLITGSCSTGTSQNVPSMDFMSSTSIFTQRGDSSNRGINWTVFDQHRLFSAKEKMFAPQASVSQYRPRNSGGNIIMSVAPGTKPEPRWCPIGLSHTQKRRVQRMRALEIREEITEKELEEWFNRGRPMVPQKMIWKKKHIMTDKNRNADDIVTDGISEKFQDAPTHMDVHQGG
jgi:hypothetical protein